MYVALPAPSVYCADVIALFVDYALCMFCAVMDKLHMGVLSY